MEKEKNTDGLSTIELFDVIKKESENVFNKIDNKESLTFYDILILHNTKLLFHGFNIVLRKKVNK